MDGGRLILGGLGSGGWCGDRWERWVGVRCGIGRMGLRASGVFFERRLGRWIGIG